ncbi:MAG: hypothetical protein RBT62_03845 [Spirochaetia bacterium]|nr:hypothetical protein [Spirochaetia bacterium]
MLRVPRRYMLLATIVLSSMLLLGATPEPPLDALALVPTGALAVMTVGNPELLIGNTMGFLRNAGLEKQANSLSDALESMLKPANDGSSQGISALKKYIQLSRRFLVALFPGADTEPRALVFIPLLPGLSPTDLSRLHVALADMAGDSVVDLSIASDYPGYLVLGTEGLVAPEYGSVPTIDLAALAGYDPASLVLWADAHDEESYLKKLAPFLYGSGGNVGLSGDEYEPNLLDNSRRAHSDDSGDTSEEKLEGLVEDAITNGLSELKTLRFSLTVQAEHAWIRLVADLKHGSTLADLAASASSGDKTLPYLQYCEADSMLSAAWSLPQDWSAPLLKTFYTKLFSDSSLSSSITTSFNAFAASSGMNGGFSIDFDPSKELFKKLTSEFESGEEEALAQVIKSLGFSFSGTLQLKDRQAFREAGDSVMALLDDPGFAELLSDSDMSLSIDRVKGLVERLPYDRYSYVLKRGDGSKIDKLPPLVYVYKDDKVYLGFDSPQVVAKTAIRDGARKSLRQDAAFMALNSGAPADAIALQYLSTKALARILLKVLPAEKLPLPFNSKDLTGILSWLEATPGTMGMGLGLGANDIRAVVDLMPWIEGTQEGSLQ